MAQVEVFTEGKVKERNEDRFAHSDDVFVLVDGATDKSGRTYDGKTGGEIVAELATRECLTAGLDGVDLVEYLNGKIREKYRELGILDDVTDAKYRFTGTLVQVRIVGDRLVVTSLGDSGFRVNGKDSYQDGKQVDVENAERRAKYIAETGDVAGGREHIMPFLFEQFSYQNVPGIPLGYGVMDGTETPSEYVHVFEYPSVEVHTIELHSDGYFRLPEEPTIAAWEEAHASVEAEDPDKWKTYKSTKSKDDRTVAIVRF